MLLLILLCLCSTAGSTLFANEKYTKTYMGLFRFSNWIGTIERFLQLEQWVKDVDYNECHTEEALIHVEQYIPLLIERLKNTLERNHGLGTKFIKLHLLVHHVEAHRKYGKLANTDSSFGETRHKHFAKQPGNQTQRRKETFDAEVANRNIDAVLLALGNSALKQSQNHVAQLGDIPKFKTRLTEGPMYSVSSTYAKKHQRTTCNVPTDDPRTPPAVARCLRFLQCDILPLLARSKEISTYHTLLCSEGHIYRCCPNYRKMPWYDWATVTRADGTQRTMQILVIFWQPFTYDMPILLANDTDISKEGAYLIGLFLDGMEFSARSHKESEMLFSGKLVETIQCVSSENIVSPIAVYRDFDFADKKKMSGLVHTGYYGIIHPRKTWARILLKRAKGDERISANTTKNSRKKKR